MGLLPITAAASNGHLSNAVAVLVGAVMVALVVLARRRGTRAARRRIERWQRMDRVEVEQELDTRRAKAQRSTRRINRVSLVLLVPWIAFGVLLIGACVAGGVWVGAAAFFVLFFVLPPIIFHLMRRVQT
jgi:hypothetical protein